jgi:hypothetical protein
MRPVARAGSWQSGKRGADGLRGHRGKCKGTETQFQEILAYSIAASRTSYPAILKLGIFGQKLGLFLPIKEQKMPQNALFAKAAIPREIVARVAKMPGTAYRPPALATPSWATANRTSPSRRSTSAGASVLCR